MPGNWSCDLRANERPQNKLHWRGQHTLKVTDMSTLWLTQRAESVKIYSNLLVRDKFTVSMRQIIYLFFDIIVFSQKYFFLRLKDVCDSAKSTLQLQNSLIIADSFFFFLHKLYTLPYIKRPQLKIGKSEFYQQKRSLIHVLAYLSYNSKDSSKPPSEIKFRCIGINICSFHSKRVAKRPWITNGKTNI